MVVYDSYFVDICFLIAPLRNVEFVMLPEANPYTQTKHATNSRYIWPIIRLKKSWHDWKCYEVTWKPMLCICSVVNVRKHRTLNTSNSVCRFAFIRITRFKNLQRLLCTNTHTRAINKRRRSYVYAKSLNWLSTFDVILRVIVLIPTICVSDFFSFKSIFPRLTYVINGYFAFAFENKSKSDLPTYQWVISIFLSENLVLPYSAHPSLS